MELRKLVVLGTALIAFGSLGLISFFSLGRAPFEPAFDTTNQPSFGQGKIEMVVFEDFRCQSCRVFSEEIFPQILEAYIETGKARYTFIPLAFLEGSKPLANAALAVYHQNRDRFFPFVHELFQNQPVSLEAILRLARRVGDIDLNALSDSMGAHLYDQEIDRNLELARRLMGSQLSAPALFINGKGTSTTSFEKIAERVDAILEEML